MEETQRIYFNPNWDKPKKHTEGKSIYYDFNSKPTELDKKNSSLITHDIPLNGDIFTDYFVNLYSTLKK